MNLIGLSWNQIHAKKFSTAFATKYLGACLGPLFSYWSVILPLNTFSWVLKMEGPKLNPQQTYLFSSDSHLIASLVPAISLKFWYMFIIEISLCSFVRLDAITKSEKKATVEGGGGLVLIFRLFYVSVDHMFSLV